MIGIDRYAHWQRLSNAMHDAVGAAKQFQQLGFECVVPPRLDGAATFKAIWSLVLDELVTIGSEDSLVVFYAGHGATQKHALGNSVIKTGYLVPVDGDDRASTWIDLESWLRAVARLPAKHILVILDACHSGIALDPVIKWRDPNSWRDEPMASLRERRSRRVITSALEDQIALDSGPVPGHSLFTGCLIEALSHGIDGRGVATGSEIGLYVQRRVERYPGSRQTPDFGSFAYDDRGEMVIQLGPGLHEAAPAPPAPNLSAMTAAPRRQRPRVATRVAAVSLMLAATAIALKPGVGLRSASTANPAVPAETSTAAPRPVSSNPDPGADNRVAPAVVAPDTAALAPGASSARLDTASIGRGPKPAPSQEPPAPTASANAVAPGRPAPLHHAFGGVLASDLEALPDMATRFGYSVPSEPPQESRGIRLQEADRDYDRRERITRVDADYLPAKFDPSSYFAKAQALARAQASDAELVGAMFQPVTRDGSVNMALVAKLEFCALHEQCRRNVFLFRSPSRSKLPTNVSTNLPATLIPRRDCLIAVFPLETWVMVRRIEDTRCDAPTGPPPRCSLAQVWSAAIAQGAPIGTVARISWESGSWSFTTDLEDEQTNTGAFVRELPDRC